MYSINGVSVHPERFFHIRQKSIFTTFRLLSTGPEYFSRHMQRLADSAQIMDIDASIPMEEIAVFLRTKTTDHTQRCKVVWNGKEWGSVIQNMTLLPKVITVIDKVFSRPNPTAKYATTRYTQVMESQKPHFETLFFTPDGYVQEGNITNVFAVIEGILCTPNQGLLPGITRQIILEKHAVNLQKIHKSELRNASEILLTNAIRGIVSVEEWGSWRRASTVFYDCLRGNL